MLGLQHCSRQQQSASLGSTYKKRLLLLLVLVMDTCCCSSCKVQLTVQEQLTSSICLGRNTLQQHSSILPRPWGSSCCLKHEGASLLLQQLCTLAQLDSCQQGWSAHHTRGR